VENAHANVAVAAGARLQRQITIVAGRKQISATHVVVMMAFGIISIKFRLAIMTCGGSIVCNTLGIAECDHRSLHGHNLINQFRLGENSVEKVFCGSFARVDFRFDLVLYVFGHAMQTEAGYLVAIDDRGVVNFREVSPEIANEAKIVFVFVLIVRERQFTLLPFFWIWERDLLRLMYATQAFVVTQHSFAAKHLQTAQIDVAGSVIHAAIGDKPAQMFHIGVVFFSAVGRVIQQKHSYRVTTLVRMWTQIQYRERTILIGNYAVDRNLMVLIFKFRVQDQQERSYCQKMGSSHA